LFLKLKQTKKSWIYLLEKKTKSTKLPTKNKRKKKYQNALYSIIERGKIRNMCMFVCVCVCVKSCGLKWYIDHAVSQDLHMCKYVIHCVFV
jgi:hypothetical protein